LIEPDEWIPAPASPALAPGEVHVWIARLPLGAEELAWCESLLAEDERDRAASAHLPVERARYVATRGLLRTLLARYAGARAAAIRFVYGPHGKPALAAEGAAIGFNVSHAGDATLLAFARDRAVGVDVERVREVPRAERIMTRIVGPEAVRAWRALPAAERRESFMREWTKLEARSKLTGEGVWRTVIRREHELGEPGCTFELRPLDGYLGALVVEGEGVRLRSWRYQEGSLSRSASSSSGGTGGEK
jgi:4'-phosphopantetheinyl transferase